MAVGERTIVEGERHYEVPGGVTYPSATTILKATRTAEQRRAIVEWRARVGDEAAELISVEARERGDALHHAVERWAEGGDPADSPWWKSIEHVLRGVHRPPVAIERFVHDGVIRVAGSLDLAAEANGGGVWVYDWKTSSKRKHRAFIADYLQQVAFYAVAACRCMPEALQDLRGAVIVVAYEDRRGDCYTLTRRQVLEEYARFRARAETWWAVRCP